MTEHDHVIDVKSIQKYVGQVVPEELESGEIPSEARELHCVGALRRSFECKCGQRFRKWRTAAEHLQEAAGDGDD